MIDKIRLHLAGELPQEYVPNLGSGFDQRCVHFLQISYRDLVDHVTGHLDASDDDLLSWSLNAGRHPDEDDMEAWNEFMRKRGWKDAMTPRLEQRKHEGGFADRADIETFFQFIDADEGRL